MPQPRSFVITILSLLALAVGVGASVISLPVLTHAVALVMPSALAVPIGIPPVGLPGSEPVMMWVADLVAALVLLLVVARYLLKKALPTRGSVWRRTVMAVILGLVVGNLIRAVAWTFYTSPSITIYAVTIGLSAVLSALIGILLGSIIGLLATLAWRPTAIARASSSGKPAAAVAIGKQEKSRRRDTGTTGAAPGRA